jgi:hypothetical protein
MSTVINVDGGGVFPVGGGGAGGSGGGGSGGSGGGNMCAHDTCTAGVALMASCDPCVATVCASDAYCCSTQWNARCVTEASSVCSCSSGGGGSGGGGSGGSGGGGGSGGSGGSGGAGGGGGSMMKFAVFGDARPPNLDDTSGYPSAVIGNIFALAQKNGAQFVVGTGDYMYADNASAVNAQVPLFKTAMANFTAGPIYLTMGNHECTGYTDSNCPNLNETPNVQAFMTLLPSGVTKPYYRIDVATPLGTAKFLFVAANSWDSAGTQQAWLSAQLAQATTYTFVMRHEATTDATAPGVTPSENLINKAAYTLELNGHTHEYRRLDTKHVISGNGGAPLTGGGGYGLLIVTQLANGNLTVDEIDESSGNVTDTWSVTPAGAAAP